MQTRRNGNPLLSFINCLAVPTSEGNQQLMARLGGEGDESQQPCCKYHINGHNQLETSRTSSMCTKW